MQNTVPQIRRDESRIRYKSSSQVRLRARAKLNLTLRVLGRFEDDYHLLQSLVVPISLADEVAISLSEEPGIRCETIFAPELAEQVRRQSLKDSDFASALKGLEPKSNLAYRAAQLFLDNQHAKTKATQVKGLDIKIQKQIPFGAGLGGGSADAAAVLLGLDLLLKTGLADAELYSLGLKLGADVPLTLADVPVLMEGKGEQLTACPNAASAFFTELSKFDLFILKPDFSVSTAKAYDLFNYAPSLKAGSREVEELLGSAREELEARTGIRFSTCLTGTDKPQEKLPHKVLTLLEPACKGSGPKTGAFAESKLPNDRLNESANSADSSSNSADSSSVSCHTAVLAERCLSALLNDFQAPVLRYFFPRSFFSGYFPPEGPLKSLITGEVEGKKNSGEKNSEVGVGNRGESLTENFYSVADRASAKSPVETGSSGAETAAENSGRDIRFLLCGSGSALACFSKAGSLDSSVLQGVLGEGVLIQKAKIELA